MVLIEDRLTVAQARIISEKHHGLGKIISIIDKAIIEEANNGSYELSDFHKLDNIDINEKILVKIIEHYKIKGFKAGYSTLPNSSEITAIINWY